MPKGYTLLDGQTRSVEISAAIAWWYFEVLSVTEHGRFGKLSVTVVRSMVVLRSFLCQDRRTQRDFAGERA